jgi:hypothetical protein
MSGNFLTSQSLRNLTTSKINFCVLKESAIVPILSQLNTVHVLTHPCY